MGHTGQESLRFLNAPTKTELALLSTPHSQRYGIVEKSQRTIWRGAY
jgi:hypothetical protein